MRAVAASAVSAPDHALVGYKRAFVLAVAAFVLVTMARVHEVLPQLQPLRLGMLSTAITVVMAMGAFRRDLVSEFFSTPVAKGLLVVIGFAFLTVPTAEWPTASIKFLYQVLIYPVILLVVVAMAYADRRAMRLVVTSVVLVVTMAGFISVRAGTGRFEIGLTYDANDSASLFVLTIPWAIYLLLTEKGARRLLGMVAIPACLFGILQTGSRGGLLGAGALVPFLVYLSPPKRRAPFILLVGIGAVATVLAMGDRAIARFYKAFDPNEYNYTTEDGRIEIWKRGLSYIRQSPVVGVGIDGFQYKELVSKTNKGSGVRQAAAHNMYLQVAADLGLIGFSGFLTMLFGGLVLCSRARKRAKRRAVEDPEAYRELLRANMAQASLFSIMCTGFFLSLGYSAMVYYVCGAAVGVWLGSTRMGSGMGPAATPRPQPQPVRGMRGWRSARPLPAGFHADHRPSI